MGHFVYRSILFKRIYLSLSNICQHRLLQNRATTRNFSCVDILSLCKASVYIYFSFGEKIFFLDFQS